VATDYDLILWGKIVKGPDTECWAWQGPVNEKGRGVLRVAGKFRYAHRVAWERSRGQELQGCNWIEQICGVNRCCNPRHLRVRSFRGSGHPCSKLTEDEAVEIYNLYWSGESQSKLAKRFGIGRKTVGRIANGETWGHVTSR
jgi:hypothetical protein